MQPLERLKENFQPDYCPAFARFSPMAAGTPSWLIDVANPSARPRRKKLDQMTALSGA